MIYNNTLNFDLVKLIFIVLGPDMQGNSSATVSKPLNNSFIYSF